jgi:hypothetical protein
VVLQPIMGDLGIYLKVSSRHEPQLLPMDKLGDVQIIEAVVDTSSQPSGQIQELGVYSDQFCGSDQTIPVLEIHTMTIIPCRHDQTPATPTIYNARVEECGEGEVKHTRLYWEYADRDSTRIYGMPHSEMTGPFSYFDLEINGVPAGRWYALECILSKGVAEVLRTAEVRFKITGVSFDGQALACHTATLSVTQRWLKEFNKIGQDQDLIARFPASRRVGSCMLCHESIDEVAWTGWLIGPCASRCVADDRIAMRQNV